MSVCMHVSSCQSTNYRTTPEYSNDLDLDYFWANKYMQPYQRGIIQASYITLSDKVKNMISPSIPELLLQEY